MNKKKKTKKPKKREEKNKGKKKNKTNKKKQNKWKKKQKKGKKKKKPKNKKKEEKIGRAHNKTTKKQPLFENSFARKKKNKTLTSQIQSTLTVSHPYIKQLYT